jgi:hypothetical protein
MHRVVPFGSELSAIEEVAGNTGADRFAETPVVAALRLLAGDALIVRLAFRILFAALAALVSKTDLSLRTPGRFVAFRRPDTSRRCDQPHRA